MKKKILMALCLLAVAGLSIGGTVAYFKAQDTSVNTFTYGEVAIQQLQYERKVEDGVWVKSTTVDKYGYYPDLLVEYKNDNVLLPAVFADGVIKWDDRNGSEEASGEGSHQQSWAEIGASGSNQLFDASVKNVQDNFVFVKNTGTNNAYIRTYFAFEQGDLEVSESVVRNGQEVPYAEYFDVIEMNTNLSHWEWNLVAKDYVIYDDNNVANKYIIMSATYLGPKSNPTGILASGVTSYPSLLQLYMLPSVTQNEIALLDGNGNKTFDILIATQAVQADGFDDANQAFTQAFNNELPFKIEKTN